MVVVLKTGNQVSQPLRVEVHPELVVQQELVDKKDICQETAVGPVAAVVFWATDMVVMETGTAEPYQEP
jgi:hypothetical protein